MSAIWRCGIVALLLLGGCKQITLPVPDDPGTPLPPGPHSIELEDSHLTISIDPAPPGTPGTPLSIKLDLLAKTDLSLPFTTSQRFDIEVTKDGLPVWKVSDGKAYLQVLGEEKVTKGDAIRYGDIWTPTEIATFTIKGWITATNRPDLMVERELEVN